MGEVGANGGDRRMSEGVPGISGGGGLRGTWNKPGYPYEKKKSVSQIERKHSKKHV